MKNPKRPKPKADALGRFSRDCPVSTGKRVSLIPRDLTWLEALQRHGDLPSPILHEFTSATHRSAQYTRRRLTELWREANTPHKGRYLDRPWQRNWTPNARSNHEIYTLNKRSTNALKDHGIIRDNTPKGSSSWRHDFLRACYSASIELSCLRKGLTYIHHDEIVDRFGAHEFNVDGEKMRPDIMHGIRYPDGFTKLYLVEIDCATEPIRSKSRNRHKSIEKMFEQYKKFIGKGMYKRALNLDSGVLLVTVTTNLTHMQNLMAAAGSANYMLFGFVPNFEHYFKPPKPLPFLDEPWLRPGREPFDMSGQRVGS